MRFTIAITWAKGLSVVVESADSLIGHLLVRSNDVLHGFINRISKQEKVHILGVDISFSHQGICHPLNQTRPVFGTDQHDWLVGYLAGLHHAEHFKKLIHRTHATWQTDKSLRVLQKHGLARKEVPEINAKVDILVKALLKG